MLQQRQAEMLTVKNVIPKHLEATTAKADRDLDVRSTEFDDAVRVSSNGRLQRHAGKDLAVSGIPDRYAAADCGNTGTGRGNQHRDREYF